MTVSHYLQRKLPKKRKANKLQEAGPSRCLFLNLEECNDDSEETDEEMEIDMDYSTPFKFLCSLNS